jgi:hypothetical protein
MELVLISLLPVDLDFWGLLAPSLLQSVWVVQQTCLSLCLSCRTCNAFGISSLCIACTDLE